MNRLTAHIPLISLALIVLCTTCVGGCSSSRSKQEMELRSTTTGQELADLQMAYDRGILTEREYLKQKKKILKRD